MFIEVKGHDRADFFKDPPLPKNDNETVDRGMHQFVLNVAQSKETQAREDLGQIVAYATEACARQHRIAYFSISVTEIGRAHV